MRTASEESIVFQTSYDFTIPPARPMAYLVERAGRPRTSASRPAWRSRRAPTSSPFEQPPKVGNAMYLGFDTSLARLLLRIDVECSQARGAGVDPEDPPLRFEVSDESSETGWSEAIVLSDLTGGFNYGSGAIELQLPSRALAEHDRRPARVLGALPPGRRHALGRAAAPVSPTRPRSTPSRPARSARSSPPRTPRGTSRRCSGESDGSAGPALPAALLARARAHAGRAPRGARPGSARTWQAWEQRESFAESGPDDRHYVLDAADGTIELGPAVRAPDGSWRQYGRVPPARALLRMTGYRDGGGRRGNVTAGTLSVLKSAIPGVVSVSTRSARPAESTSRRSRARRVRAAMELRTRYRAVTARGLRVPLRRGLAARRARALPARQGGQHPRLHRPGHRRRPTGCSRRMS